MLLNWVYKKKTKVQKDSAEFCLKAFLNVALRIQDAEWIPGAISFDIIYEHKITALTDNVEIVQRNNNFSISNEKIVIKTLAKGETIFGKIEKKDSSDSLIAMLQGREYIPMLSFANYKDNIFGEIEENKVQVTCVPKEDNFIKEYFPNLNEINYKSF